MKKIGVLIIGLLGAIPLFAQLLQDIPTQNMASQALEKIYSYDFQTAKNLTVQIQQKYPQHPVVPFLQAYTLSWEKLPLQKSMPEYTTYNQYMQQGLNFAQAMLNVNKEDLEAQFFAMTILSLLSLHESESGDFGQSVSYGRKSFNYMKKGFKLTEKYPDFHFSTGVYKYYAVQYPETHPIAKPFMIFFPGGNKQEGISHLNQAVQKSKFSKTEALVYLGGIYAKYEQNYQSALSCAERLVLQYPKNSFFWMKYCEMLINVGRYAEAELNLSKFSQRTELMYQTAHTLFKGLLQEKYYKNLPNAKTLYQKVISVQTYDKRYTKDYVAFAYAGLARIAHQEGKRDIAKDYYKKTLKLSEYEGLKAEAKKYK